MSAFLRVSARANPLECQRYVVPCESRRAMVSCRRRDQSCYVVPVSLGGSDDPSAAHYKPEPDAIPFEPKSFADDSGTARRQRNAIAKETAE